MITMFRFRRYRAFIVFTAVFILLVYYGTRSARSTPRSIGNVELDQSMRPAIPVEPPPPANANPNANPANAHKNENNDDDDDDDDAAHVDRPDQASSEDEEEEEEPFISEFGAQGQARLEVTPPESQSSLPHWEKLPEHFPVPDEDVNQLPPGQLRPLKRLQAVLKGESPAEKTERLQRLDAVKRAFDHAWSGYKKKAMGHDEFYPVQGGVRDPFNGWGATLVDSLDTLWVMDETAEFVAALDVVRKIDFTTSARKDIPVFETVIRYLGGLLGAYDISGQRFQVLLDKAVQLADVVIGAFDTPNRMPLPYYHWAPAYASQPHRSGVRAVLAELGSLSLEMTRLSQLTGQSKYYDAVARVTNELEKLQNATKLPGLWPLRIDASGCVKNRPDANRENDDRDVLSAQSKNFAPKDIESHKNLLRDDGEGLSRAKSTNTSRTAIKKRAPIGEVKVRTPSEQKCKGGLYTPLDTPDTFSIGSLAGSAYEYLPKQYMLLGGLNDQYRTMYETAMNATRKYLLFRPMVKEDRDLRFAATVTLTKPLDTARPGRWSYNYEGEHLACFAGGMFAVGAKIFGLDGDMETAAKLTDGCVWAHESTRTGIMPERFKLLPCENAESCPWDETRYHKALDPGAEARNRWVLNQKRPEPAAQVQGEQRGSVNIPSRNSPKHKGYQKRDMLSSSGTTSSSVEAAAASATPSATAGGEILNDRNDARADQTLIASHKDYVNARIRDERLPPGVVNINSYKYTLRPEAIESVFVMFRLTGDNYWREKGWNMFQAVVKYTTTELANSDIDDVTAEAPQFEDQMESYWLAETLKYYYLLFSDPGLVSLDDFVLNTEAHPFKRPVPAP